MNNILTRGIFVFVDPKCQIPKHGLNSGVYETNFKRISKRFWKLNLYFFEILIKSSIV